MAMVSIQELIQAWDWCMKNPDPNEHDMYLRTVRRALNDPHYVLTRDNRAAVKRALHFHVYSTSFNMHGTVYEYTGPERRQPEFSKLRQILDERKAEAVTVDFKEIINGNV